jgi:SAM-dependent methyltransferase
VGAFTPAPSPADAALKWFDDRTRVVSPEFDFDATFEPEVYLHFYESHLGGARSEADADLVEQALALDRDEHLLDVPCGHGRVANRLAERGYRVTGVDRSTGFLDRARADAAERGVDVAYRRGDMRELPVADDSVDGAFSLFTSFGYFDDADNRRVLEEAKRVLRPGGRFLIEMVHQLGVVADFESATVSRAGPGDRDVLLDEHAFDAAEGRVYVERTAFVDGGRHESTYSVRLYTAPELRERFEAAGLDVVGIYDGALGALTRDSNRMVVVGEA